MGAALMIAPFLEDAFQGLVGLRDHLARQQVELGNVAVVYRPSALKMDLRLMGKQSETTRFLCWEKTDVKPLFSLQLSLVIKPELREAAAPAGLEFGVPDFLTDLDAPRDESFRFCAASGRDYQISFGGEDSVKIVLLSTGTDDQVLLTKGKPLDAQGANAVMELIETLAAWARSNYPVSKTFPYKRLGIATEGSLREALDQVDEEVQASHKICISATGGRSGAAISLKDFRANLTFYVSQTGQALDDPGVDSPDDVWWGHTADGSAINGFDSQQFSFLLEPGTTQNGNSCFLLRPMVPDLLVAGEWHERFQRMLTSDDATIQNALNESAGRLGITPEALQQSWLEAVSSGRFVVVREGQLLSGRKKQRLWYPAQGTTAAK
jgi:hypothetical protein